MDEVVNEIESFDGLNVALWRSHQSNGQTRPGTLWQGAQSSLRAALIAMRCGWQLVYLQWDVKNTTG